MGDYFQTIVDPECSKEMAELLATKVCSSLIADGIILREKSECVFSDDGLGHPPGPNCSMIIDFGNDNKSNDIVKQMLAWLPNLTTNGLAVITKRTVFHSGQGESRLICPACSRQFDTPQWQSAIDEWYDERGAGLVICPVCRKSIAITECMPDWGFGNLGFEFWNWPPLSKSFVKSIGEKLGHKTVFVAGKL